MEVLYFLVAISVVGVAAVFWLIKNEQNAEGVPLKNIEPGLGPAVPSLPKARSLSDLFQKFGLGKKADRAPGGDVPHQSASFSLSGLFAKGPKKEEAVTKEFAVLKEAGPSLTESIGEEIKLSVDEEKKIDREIELMAQLDEIKEQNKNLDRIFKEKSAALEKAEESLENELRNRKEFNKVKDILEKELKESKDRSRELQMELGTVKTESESYQKRVNELAEKVAELERQVVQRNDEVANLTKRLQTFASPATAATPPQPETAKSEQAAAAQETVPLAQEPLARREDQTPVPDPASDQGGAGQSPLPAPETDISSSVAPQEPASTDEKSGETEYLSLGPDILSSPLKPQPDGSPARQDEGTVPGVPDLGQLKEKKSEILEDEEKNR